LLSAGDLIVLAALRDWPVRLHSVYADGPDGAVGAWNDHDSDCSHVPDEVMYRVGVVGPCRLRLFCGDCAVPASVDFHRLGKHDSLPFTSLHMLRMKPLSRLGGTDTPPSIWTALDRSNRGPVGEASVVTTGISRLHRKFMNPWANT
jgi:hypothetical protein